MKEDELISMAISLVDLCEGSRTLPPLMITLGLKKYELTHKDPYNLGGFSELLPVLDIGEALVVGDASLLPSRIRISRPINEPDGGTINFWDEWKVCDKVDRVEIAVKSWRMQSMQDYESSEGCSTS